MVFPADTGLLVAAEGRMGRIGVVAIRPDPSGLDATAEAVAGTGIAAPHTGAEAVERVIGNRQGFFLVLERGHGNDRAEDFLLEDPHPVVALQHGRFDIITIAQLARQAGGLTAGQDLGAFLAADIEIGENFLLLLGRGLCANHRFRIERAALLDRRDAFEGALHEAVIDVFLNERA